MKNYQIISVCQYDDGLPPYVEEDAHEGELDNAPGGEHHPAEG